MLSRENPCCVSDGPSPPRSVWEKVLPSSCLFSFLLGNFDACDIVRQASELENSLLARD